MESEALTAGGPPEALGEVLAGLFGREATARMDESRRAAAAWAAVNGDAERAHTCTAYLEPARRARLAPVLVVEVDSHALLSDFNAKRELYLGRLANYGLAVSGLRFRFAPSPVPGVPMAPTSRPARPLTPSERARVDELASLVAAPLRAPVTRALEAHFRHGPPT